MSTRMRRSVESEEKYREWRRRVWFGPEASETVKKKVVTENQFRSPI